MTTSTEVLFYLFVSIVEIHYMLLLDSLEILYPFLCIGQMNVTPASFLHACTQHTNMFFFLLESFTCFPGAGMSYYYGTIIFAPYFPTDGAFLCFLLLPSYYYCLGIATAIEQEVEVVYQ